MPRPAHLLAPILLSLVSSACGAELASREASPAGLPFAFAVHDCAPWDGPAVTIYLTPTAGSGSTPLSWPHVRVSVWRAAETLPGSSFSWPSDTQVGVAARCTGPDDCVQANRGRIRFRAHEPDGMLAGFTELTFADGTRLEGGFRAVLGRSRAFCG